jgi:hypothetical protein
MTTWQSQRFIQKKRPRWGLVRLVRHARYLMRGEMWSFAGVRIRHSLFSSM